MHSASIAEWMVSRWTGKGNAASIVGDLVEMKQQKGNLWFWLSVAGVVLSLSWRQHAASIAAFIAAYWTVVALNGWTKPPFMPDTHHLSLWQWAFCMAVVGCLLGWMAVVYTVIRYGISDELTQFALVWTGITTAVCCGWRQPIVSMLCIFLILCTIAACIAWAKWRRAALTLFVSMFAGLACFSLSGFIVSWYHYYLFRHFGIWMAYYCFLGVVYSTSFFSTYAAAMVCSWMHDRGTNHYLLPTESMD